MSRCTWAGIDAIERRFPRETAKCVICDHEGSVGRFETLRAECQFGGGDLVRHQCPVCDAIFGPAKMLELGPRALDLEYRVLYATYGEVDSTEREIRTFHSLQPAAGKLYLNWGCGSWAMTIDHLRGEGFDVWGYEPSVGTDNPFIAINPPDKEAVFDGIFSNDVVEHFLDPVSQFRAFASILKPGGRMAHSSPCYVYAGADTRFHTIFYVGRSLDVLAERTGFAIKWREQEGSYRNVVFEKK